jgi:murein DD-endopeptidase MepM/ murein hydrolase activator NlpD
MQRIALFLILALIVPSLPVGAQANVDCGIVDAIDYPIGGISLENDDFGMYRAAWGGYHAGMDMAFERPGEVIRAAARGRVTFSDPAGWGTEKGVVVIEHIFPDRSVAFTLYGHMEPTAEAPFPPVGRCVERGDIVGTVGRPQNSAPHLHYEIRRMRASTGGPGYWTTNPQDGGWFHPVEFTERWRLRLNPAFRALISATSAPVAPPMWQPDGSAIFATQGAVEQRLPATNSAANPDPVWALHVNGLVSAAPLPDGRVLGMTERGQMYIVAGGRFVSSWLPSSPLKTGPLRVADALVWLDTANRAVAYTAEGQPVWQTEPLGLRVERYAVSGGLLAVATENNGTYALTVISAAGGIVYAGQAPAPITPIPAPNSGFLITVGSQISLLTADGQLRPLIDAGRALGRGSYAVRDAAGNLYVYPGSGREVYAYAPDGGLRWSARLSGFAGNPPLIAVGGGCLVYVLTGEGTLNALRTVDGTLLGMARLYAGGDQGRAGARVLSVLPGELVQFSAGYLSTAIVDGLALTGLPACG